MFVLFCVAEFSGFLGTPVVPFGPFYSGVSIFKLNIRKKGTLIIQESLGNLGLGHKATIPCSWRIKREKTMDNELEIRVTHLLRPPGSDK